MSGELVNASKKSVGWNPAAAPSPAAATWNAPILKPQAGR